LKEVALLLVLATEVYGIGTLVLSGSWVGQQIGKLRILQVGVLLVHCLGLVVQLQIPQVQLPVELPASILA
jgi:hypothetical protein